MGLRFRRSFRIVSGVRLNVSKSGASISFGRRGMHYTVGSKGTRTTIGIPGSGLSWTQYRSFPTQRRSFASGGLLLLLFVIGLWAVALINGVRRPPEVASIPPPPPIGSSQATAKTHRLAAGELNGEGPTAAYFSIVSESSNGLIAVPVPLPRPRPKKFGVLLGAPTLHH
jgi:hypothetical protein